MGVAIEPMFLRKMKYEMGLQKAVSNKKRP